MIYDYNFKYIGIDYDIIPKERRVTMNSRHRKKYAYVMTECAHNKTYVEQVPYGDYYVPCEVFKCARQPQFTERFSDGFQDCSSDICMTCKSFILSREKMRLGRERRKAEKWINRHFFQKEITIDPTSLKFKIF